MPRYVFLVFSDPANGQDAQYNDWYDHTHLRDVLKIPGFVAAERFKLQPSRSGEPAPPWSYAAFYEIETDDLPGAMEELRIRIGTSAMLMSPAFDLSTTKGFIAVPIGHQKAEPATSGNG